MALFGAHMSIAGGISRAFERISRIQGEALQIFSKNQRQWRSSALTNVEIDGFRNARNTWGEGPIAVHDSYLINLANPKKEAANKSIAAFSDEIKRTAQLDIPFLVMHPGAHLGEGVDNGLKRLAKNLDQAIENASVDSVTILLETTAGQGSGIGARFEEIAFVLENSIYGRLLGVCYDTCHTFAAGYDIRTPESYARTFSEFDRYIGLEQLRFFHLNDSKRELGSRVDRHEHIGRGHIGLEGFRLLVNDDRFMNHPMVLETPKGKDLAEDRENIAVLRKMVQK